MGNKANKAAKKQAAEQAKNQAANRVLGQPLGQSLCSPCQPFAQSAFPQSFGSPCQPNLGQFPSGFGVPQCPPPPCANPCANPCQSQPQSTYGGFPSGLYPSFGAPLGQSQNFPSLGGYRAC